MDEMDKLDGLLAELLKMPEERRRKVIERDQPPRRLLDAAPTTVGSITGAAVRTRAKAPVLPGVRMDPDGVVTVSVLIQLKGSSHNLERHGARVQAILGDTASADVPLEALAMVATDDDVLFIEAVDPVLPLLETSVPEIGASTPSHPSAGGSGALVAVIDMNGLDLHHPDFAGRISSMWDQNADLSGSVRGRVPPVGYGLVFTAEDILAEVGSRLPYSVIPRPPSGNHGTHVAGIAVGSGAASNGRYRGVAPDAHLMFVNLREASYRSSHTQHLFHALQHVDTVAGSAPCAVNISLGWASGPRDGTSAVERAIDHISAKPGRAVVVAAGNEGGSKRYAVREIPPSGELDLTLVVPPYTLNNERIEIWYPHDSTLQATVLALDALGREEQIDGNHGTLVTIGHGRRTYQGDHCLQIIIQPTNAVRSGNWIVRLRRLSTRDKSMRLRVHATIFGNTSMTWEQRGTYPQRGTKAGPRRTGNGD